jgi:1-deoxy-D-xylulose-5-phosphate synthase
MQRAYDQVIHDVALQSLNVVFCLDRGGLVGADGATHHGAFDLAFMRCIPNIVVASPMNEEELRNMMFTAQLPDAGTWSIRYPRGNGVMPEWRTPFQQMDVGKGRKLRDGVDVAILTIGPLGVTALEACAELGLNGVSAAHYDMRFVKPVDEELLHRVFKKFTKVITLEDGCRMGGFGSAVVEFMADNGYFAQVERMGIPDRFIDHGSPKELFIECGYHKDDLVRAALRLVHEPKAAIAG